MVKLLNVPVLALLGLILTASCGLLPEKVSMDDPRLKPMFAAIDAADWTKNFTLLPEAADVRIEHPLTFEHANYDVMLHISAASSRTISFRLEGGRYRCTGEQEIHQGPNTYTTVDGTSREFISVTYDTERISGYPLNQLNVTYRGDDPKLKGHDLSLVKATPFIRQWDEANARLR